MNGWNRWMMRSMHYALRFSGSLQIFEGCGERQIFEGYGRLQIFEGLLTSRPVSCKLIENDSGNHSICPNIAGEILER